MRKKGPKNAKAFLFFTNAISFDKKKHMSLYQPFFFDFVKLFFVKRLFFETKRSSFIFSLMPQILFLLILSS